MEIPPVTPEHIETFHRAHFGPAQQAFFSHLLPHHTPVAATASTPCKTNGPLSPEPSNQYQLPEEEEEEYEDDGLGYYPDGVKRTLTDEQIAMFRFSEMQEMLREQRRALEAEATDMGLAAAKEEDSQESVTREFEMQDYSTMNQRERPQTIENVSGSLPWDDRDVREWEETQIKEKQAAEIKKLEMEKTRLAVKATYDPASGREFFWPVLGTGNINTGS